MQLAEAAEHERPYRLQRLLGRAVWDEDAAGDAVRAYTAAHLGGDVLGWLGDGEDCVAELEAVQVTAYVMDWARRREGARPDMVTLPALRSFLRFLHVVGHVRHLLVGAVPAGRRHHRHRTLARP
jgi:hypothetical protein